MPTPIANQKVLLKNKQGKVISEGRTLSTGEFTLKEIVVNGDYVLELDSKAYQGRIQVQVKGYELKGLKLKVSKKP